MNGPVASTIGVPLVDLAVQHAQIAEEVAAGFREVMASSAYIDGEEVHAFEREFAAFSGGGFCVGVANGTDALELLLRSQELPEGAEVLLPTNSFVATAEAVVRAGLRPVLTDCTDDHLLSGDTMGDRLTGATGAVIAVHLFGQQADMGSIAARLAGTGIAVFEDAAQAQGATRAGCGVGQQSAGAATSFYPGKNLGAYGDAGAVVTPDEGRADRIRCLGNHGSAAKYVHTAVGVNSRLDTLQAVVLRAKLRRLATWNDERRRAARLYETLLADVGEVRTPRTLPGNEHVWHLYVVEVDDRDHVLEELHRAGIGAGVHYPTPIHLQPGWGHLGHRRGEFPVAERHASRILSLPMFPGITDDQIGAVVSALKDAVSR